MAAKERPKLAVFKFASCDGCQLALLNLEEELLALVGEVEIAYFLEARSRTLAGPYEVVLVEGSVTTPHDQERIKAIRKDAKFLMTIGACATAGGIQALRNWQDVDQFIQMVYATPAYIKTLAQSTPISAHVPVDFELNGCPINKKQALEVITSLLLGRVPHVPAHAVCVECKQRGTVCVPVAQGIPCLGPLTHAGCGAICPAYNRGCYACFGPKETPNTESLSQDFARHGLQDPDIVRAFRGFNAYAEPFRKESESHDK